MTFTHYDRKRNEEIETVHIRCIECGSVDPPPEHRVPKGSSTLVAGDELDDYYADMEKARGE